MKVVLDEIGIRVDRIEDQEVSWRLLVVFISHRISRNCFRDAARSCFSVWAVSYSDSVSG